MDLIFHIIPLFGVLALLYTFWRSRWISKQDAGTEKMQVIAGHIAPSAMCPAITCIFSVPASCFDIQRDRQKV